MRPSTFYMWVTFGAGLVASLTACSGREREPLRSVGPQPAQSSEIAESVVRNAVPETATSLGEQSALSASFHPAAAGFFMNPSTKYRRSEELDFKFLVGAARCRIPALDDFFGIGVLTGDHREEW